ncbi:MAG: DUF2283 domain-containing protein [Methanosarcinales archaeon]|nr:DUF2283 domain-containing protein [Methanosarcinales archaeon]
MVYKSKGNKCDYDFQNDSIFFYGEINNNYNFSIDLDGIIVDFDDKNYITGIEILDASKRFSSSKKELLKINDFEATLDVNEKNVEVKMKIEIIKRNRLINKCLEALTLNSMGLPTRTQGMAVTC